MLQTRTGSVRLAEFWRSGTSASARPQHPEIRATARPTLWPMFRDRVYDAASTSTTTAVKMLFVKYRLEPDRPFGLRWPLPV